MYKIIPLKTGEQVLVDAEDYENLVETSWHRHPGGYAQGWVSIDGKRSKVLMHRWIVTPPEPLKIDHRNGNRLDNRRCNLRFCTDTTNMQNTKVREGRRYKGVYFLAHFGKYQAYIQVNGGPKQLGYFSNEIDAANAYDNAARFYFGEFARTNFPWPLDKTPTPPMHPKRGTSQYRGVRWDTQSQKWRAQLFDKIGSRKKAYSLGYFTTEEQALAAYELGCEAHNMPLKKNFS